MKMSAVMDSRTDLYNRAYGIEKATELLRSGNSIALLLVDIDNFAEYNRIYGTEKPMKCFCRSQLRKDNIKV